uniref:Uncharacterized protein n=1 Tax=Anopheles minimus TaxID=112268 RepID=A0A182WMP9_9DIPT
MLTHIQKLFLNNNYC